MARQPAAAALAILLLVCLHSCNSTPYRQVSTQLCALRASGQACVCVRLVTKQGRRLAATPCLIIYQLSQCSMLCSGGMLCRSGHSGATCSSGRKQIRTSCRRTRRTTGWHTTRRGTCMWTPLSQTQRRRWGRLTRPRPSAWACATFPQTRATRGRCTCILTLVPIQWTGTFCSLSELLVLGHDCGHAACNPRKPATCGRCTTSRRHSRWRRGW